MNTYVLGAVKPNVRQAADDAGNQFGIATIYGVAPRDGVSDHPKGLALDFMVPVGSAKGDQVAQYFQTNQQHYNVHYIIWKQRIWNVDRASEGWRGMDSRGSITANHYDHVHVSFNAGAGMPGPIIPNIPNPIGGLADQVAALTKFFTFISNPHTWLRVAMFWAGGLLIILALILIASGNSSVKSTVRSVVK